MGFQKVTSGTGAAPIDPNPPRQSVSCGRKFALWCQENSKISTAVKVGVIALASLGIAGAIIGVTGLGASSLTDLFKVLDFAHMTTTGGAIGYIGGGLGLLGLCKFVHNKNKKHRTKALRETTFLSMPPTQKAALPSNNDFKLSLVEKIGIFYENHPNICSTLKWISILLLATVMILAVIHACGVNLAIDDYLKMSESYAPMYYCLGIITFSLAAWYAKSKISNKIEKLKNDKNDPDYFLNQEQLACYFVRIPYKKRIAFEQQILEMVILSCWSTIDQTSRNNILQNWQLSTGTKGVLERYKDRVKTQSLKHRAQAIDSNCGEDFTEQFKERFFADIAEKLNIQNLSNIAYSQKRKDSDSIDSTSESDA
ncbi:MAG TPA: hypothetical protein VGJ00_08300 [Rhabdochlamydiaceae bacterium]|jgi:hypothetical protein